MRVMVNATVVDRPHLLLRTWKWCKQLQGDSPTPVFPEPGGALDQTWEIMWAFNIIDRQYAEELKLKKDFEEGIKQRLALREQLLAKQGAGA